MFWIGFGDIHENVERLALIKDLDKASGVLISGDLTNGNVKKAEEIIKFLKQKNQNIYAQIGNMDTKDVELFLEKEGINVNFKLISLTEDVFLFGAGYSTPTPFNTPSEVSEDFLKQKLYEKIEEIKKVKNLIFMTHTPPYNTETDKLLSGEHVGSLVIRNFIEEVQPQVVLTGHIHESQGVDKIGRSIIINPGTLKNGYVIIKWENNNLVPELIKL